MLEFKNETFRHALILISTCLVAAAFAGFALLKFYEEFRKGLEQKNRLRIWSALFGFAFLFILITTIIVRF